MSITTRQTILLKGDISEGFKEYRCGTANTIPGMLLQMDTDGEVIVNGEADVRNEVLVALEDDKIGMNIDGTGVLGISTTGYQEDDLIPCKLGERGEVFLMILVHTEVVTVGQYLTSNGDGKLKLADATEYRMFRAVEAADATAADVRVVAEVL